jgi:predicted aspartyl protease
MVDPGAIYSVVPRRILLEIGIAPIEIESFSLADLTQVEREAAEAAFKF